MQEKEAKKEIKERSNAHKYIHMYKVRVIKKTKSQDSYSLSMSCPSTTRKIHLRMHTDKLSHGILEPLAISINNVIVEFLFRLLEELNLLSQLPFHLP